MIESPARALDTRLRFAKFVREALRHVFPDHWSFMLGEIALYSFAILVGTGFFLALFYTGSSAQIVYHGSYRPLDGVTMSAAYRSILHISFDVPGGLLMRQMHHWAANIFIAAIVVHQARIFFTAAYRRPRDINWTVGMTLLVLALANGFFGYSMCDDLLSNAGLRIGYAIAMSVPVIGPWIAFIVMGGTVPAAATVPRFYALHIFAIPAVISVLIAVHLAIIWRQYHTNYPGPGRTNTSIVGSRLWPVYTLKSLGLFLLLLSIVAALGGFVQIDPVWIYGPANPTAIMPGAQPDWYLGWIEGAMRLFPGVNLHIGRYLVPELFFPAVLFPGLLIVALYAYPFIEEAFTRQVRSHNILRMPTQHPFNTALGCSIFAGLTVLQFAGSNDIISVATAGSVVALRTLFRVLFLVVPPVVWVVVYMLCRLANSERSARTLRLPEALEGENSAPQPQ
ncbi:MAG: cytochrome bc1 complex cytochrome b subunit [Terracidiphilus sp.]